MGRAGKTLSPKEKHIVSLTIQFVKDTLFMAEGGHDWLHTERVLKNALKINETEKGNTFTIYLGALLHDIADSKFNKGDETIGPKLAEEFLSKHNIEHSVINEVLNIIRYISFKNSPPSKFSPSKEFKIIQDADRLDALGAIGIARCFNYGGFKNREIYNPQIKPKPNQTKNEYKKSKSPSINHFYEKLLLLKDNMNTKTGKELALKRHDFMLDYLKQFFNEVGIS